MGSFWIVKNAKFLHADNEDYDRTTHMRRLFIVFGGSICQKEYFFTLMLIYTIVMNDKRSYMIQILLR